MDTKTYPPHYTDEERSWHDFLDEQLLARLRDRASGVRSSPLCWLESASEVRCLRHAGRHPYVDESSEEDSQRHCEKCGKILSHCWTDYGVENEIGYSVEVDMLDQPVDAEEAFTLLGIIDCGWPRLTERCGDWTYNPEMRAALLVIARRMEVPAGGGLMR